MESDKVPAEICLNLNQKIGMTNQFPSLMGCQNHQEGTFRKGSVAAVNPTNTATAWLGFPQYGAWGLHLCRAPCVEWGRGHKGDMIRHKSVKEWGVHQIIIL